ncbi:MAG: glycoside hydrolase [Chitinophagaceae bacterium]
MYKLIIAVLFINFTAQAQSPVTITIHPDQTVQQIRNIGTSGCWFTEEIGATWPEKDKTRIAELLFSKELDNTGKPKGIGLSAFRYNIGAGTAEQGENSGISLPAHRVECFLSPDGTYDWNKQKGYTWMLQQAKNYGVQDLIAFVNSPPVQFTKTGLGYKLVKDSLANLQEHKYQAFTDFLANVMKAFDKKNLHFNYISAINEPQWDWSGVKGQAKQEGSPFTNEEIFKVTTALNKSLNAQKLTTKMLLPEAGMLDYLYGGNLHNRSRQIEQFWDPASPYYVGKLNHSTKYVEGHGYFTDNGNAQLIKTRTKVKEALKKYKGLEYWQSEYSMLGNGFRDGKPGRLSQIDFALFLAKIIHQDFTAGNASAWHFWNAYEPGSTESPRYYLIALNPRRETNRDTLYGVTKNLWALGHYSLFVRPGMYRVETGTSDNLPDTVAAKNLMISAFKEASGKKLVINIINYISEEKSAEIILDGSATKQTYNIQSFRTSGTNGDDMKPYPVNQDGPSNKIQISLPPRSITTYVYSQSR